MNTPYLTTPIDVDTLWHTNSGFVVRGITAGKTYDYLFDSKISPGSFRDYADQFTSGARQEHEWKPYDRIGTPSPLLSGVVAHVRAQINSSLEAIPLDPQKAIEGVSVFYDEYITRAKKTEVEGLIVYRDGLLKNFQRVIDGEIPSLLDLSGIMGICGALEKR